MIALILPTMGFAKLGDTRAEAMKHYGKALNTVGSITYYHYSNWLIAQTYNSKGIACAVFYYKQGSNQITTEDASKIDAVNIPTLSPTDGIMVDSGSSNYTQWDSLDGQIALIQGWTLIGKEWMSTRGFCTPEGLMIIKDQFPDTNKTVPAHNELEV